MTRTKTIHSNLSVQSTVYSADNRMHKQESSLTCHLLFEMRNFRYSIPSCCKQ